MIDNFSETDKWPWIQFRSCEFHQFTVTLSIYYPTIYLGELEFNNDFGKYGRIVGFRAVELNLCNLTFFEQLKEAFEYVKSFLRSR